MRSFTPVFRFGHNLLVPNTIGDVPAKLFLLDTGASTNFISSAAAQEVTNVHIDSSADVEGVSGRVKRITPQSARSCSLATCGRKTKK